MCLTKKNKSKVKLLIIAGAGCTLSDATGRSSKIRPPLDRGFLKFIPPKSNTDFKLIRDYLIENYNFTEKDIKQDSIESIMAIIYADLYNSTLCDKASEAFRCLISLFNQKIAATTNILKPSLHSNLYRILCKSLDDGLLPKEIYIITFNQDIQIEKVLDKLNNTKRTNKYSIFSFPYCYDLNNPTISNPTDNKGQIFSKKGDEKNKGIRILKMHGSLNWYSICNEYITKEFLLDSNKAFKITSRKIINTEMKYRKENTFPLIIPPVINKSAIMHEDIKQLWKKADFILSNAENILVFGYSCPLSDIESANLIRRTINKNIKRKSFSIIDPNPSVIERYVNLTRLDKLFYFNSAKSYLDQPIR